MEASLHPVREPTTRAERPAVLDVYLQPGLYLNAVYNGKQFRTWQTPWWQSGPIFKNILAPCGSSATVTLTVTEESPPWAHVGVQGTSSSPQAVEKVLEAMRWFAEAVAAMLGDVPVEFSTVIPPGDDLATVATARATELGMSVRGDRATWNAQRTSVPTRS